MSDTQQGGAHPIALATERFLAHKGSARLGSDFLYLLGCPDGEDPTTNWDSQEFTPSEQAAIRACLPRILQRLLPVANELAANDVTSILGGMVYHQCWKNCIATEDGTYTLAGALLCFLDYYWADSHLDSLVESDVRAVLNAWLKPEAPWLCLPSRGVVCQHMFGPVWGSIALPDECMLIHCGDSGIVVSEIVLAERPPFHHGLCPVQKNALGLDLPALGA